MARRTRLKTKRPQRSKGTKRPRSWHRSRNSKGIGEVNRFLSDWPVQHGG
jgi:hypothetical protein